MGRFRLLVCRTWGESAGSVYGKLVSGFSNLIVVSIGYSGPLFPILSLQTFTFPGVYAFALLISGV